MFMQIIFLPGGHGIVFDGPGSKKLANLLTEAFASGDFFTFPKLQASVSARSLLASK